MLGFAPLATLPLSTLPTAIVPAVGSLAGSGALAGVGVALYEAVGTLAGSGTLSGAGQSLYEAVGTLAGNGTLVGVGRALSGSNALRRMIQSALAEGQTAETTHALLLRLEMQEILDEDEEVLALLL